MITLAMIAALAMPPAQYDHPPTHPLRVITIEAREIQAACPGFPPGLLLSCWNYDKEVVYVRDDLTPRARAKVIRHERGHANGWRHK